MMRISGRSIVGIFSLFLVIATSFLTTLNAAPILGGMENQASKHTFLEDYISNEFNSDAANANLLELGITVPNTTNGLSTEQFYKQVIANLKAKHPKLEKLRLRGGYIFKPEDTTSAVTFNNELEHLIQTLKTIDKVVNAQGIRLRRLVMTVVFGFDKTTGVNVSEVLKKAFPDEEHRANEDNWSVPFKIEHGRGVLKLSLSTDSNITEQQNGRSRYYPVSAINLRMGGPGPMIGGASYDPEKNVTKIWSAKTGNIELEGNHMDSEELEEYLPRNFNDE